MISVDCPLCPQSFEKESETAAENAVIGHIVSKVDEDHRGHGYEKARRLIDISGAEAEISETTSTEPPETAVADGGERMAPPTPEVEPQTECPTCGADGQPVDELAAELPDRVPAQAVAQLRQYDLACPACTGLGDDGTLTTEVWNRE
ncbi:MULTISPECIES: hypothetical protein [Salinibaculum]|uniref:hypothetical protein n=1 Tax=Salinibaculum TaxID=2732368 RepID=UPI0030CFDC12